MEEYKRETVGKALESAVDIGRSVHCSKDELEQIFMEIVERKYREKD